MNMKPSKLIEKLSKFDDTYRCKIESGKILMLKYAAEGIVVKIDEVKT